MSWLPADIREQALAEIEAEDTDEQPQLPRAHPDRCDSEHNAFYRNPLICMYRLGLGAVPLSSSSIAATNTSAATTQGRITRLLLGKAQQNSSNIGGDQAVSSTKSQSATAAMNGAGVSSDDEDSRSRTITAKKPKLTHTAAYFHDNKASRSVGKAANTASNALTASSRPVELDIAPSRQSSVSPPLHSPTRLSEVRVPYAIPQDLLPTSERDQGQILDALQLPSSPITEADTNGDVDGAALTPQKKKRKKRKKGNASAQHSPIQTVGQ